MDKRRSHHLDACFFAKNPIKTENTKQVKKAHLRLDAFEIKPTRGEPIKNPT